MKNLSSGLVAPSAVSEDSLRAYDVGEDILQKFIKDRLLSTTVPFHERIPALKLKTFAETAKSCSVKLTGKDVVVRADRGFFSRLVVLAQSRSIDGPPACVRLLLWSCSVSLSNTRWAVGTDVQEHAP